MNIVQQCAWVLDEPQAGALGQTSIHIDGNPTCRMSKKYRRRHKNVLARVGVGDYRQF
jgi:hypothetical protein